MKEFDLFELVLRDALLSDCRNYSILSLHKVEGLRVAKIFDHTSKKLVDIIIRKSEKGREFIEIKGNVRLLEDFKHPSGKDLMTRIAQKIHEAVCNNQGYRENIEVLCSRYTYEYLRREIGNRTYSNPFAEPSGIIQMYGCDVKVAAEEMVEEFIVTKVYQR